MIGYRFIWLTSLAACVLMMLPMPVPIVYARPDWVVMVLVYWVIFFPDKASLGTAFICGLALDVLQGVLLGQNAVALMCVTFVAIKLHLRIRIYPLPQQSIFVFLCVLLNQVILLWIGSLTNTVQLQYTFLLPAAVSAILWPWLFILLRSLCRHYRIY